MNNLKTLTAAVATAIGVAGIGVSQADEVLFPYVVSSQTVSTVLSIVNTEPDIAGQPNTIHWRYLYKEGAAATDNEANCQEVDFRWSSSPNDLLDVSVDETFGATTRGILFNDPATNAAYAPTTVSLSLLRGLNQPIRAYAVSDNNDDPTAGPIGAELTMTAGVATILEFVNGAAWGYTAYNSAAPVDSYLFDEAFEVFGEAFGPAGARDGTDFSFKPLADWTTNLYVTPLAKATTEDTNGVVTASTQTQGNLRVRVQLALVGLAVTDVVYDRDENVVSGRVPQEVVCVGAVGVEELMSTGARLLVQDTGGWGTIQTRGPQGIALGGGLGLPVSISQLRTDEATILFLEYTSATGAIDGVPLGGVVNNGYMLREL